MRRTRLTAAVGTALSAVLIAASPANATITGDATFECTVTLAFPGSGGATCTGTAVVAAAGVTTGLEAYVVAGTGSFVANVTYNESGGCPVAAPVPPVLGSAFGTATISGVPAVVLVGTTPVQTTATITTTVDWTRVASVAVVITSNTRINFGNGRLAVSTVNDVAVAAFVPLPPPLGGIPGDCSPGGSRSTTAVVSGTDFIAA